MCRKGNKEKLINFRNKKQGEHIALFLCLFALIAQLVIPFIHTWEIAVEEGYNTASEQTVSDFFDAGGYVKNEILRSEAGQEPHSSNHNPADCIVCKNLLKPQNYLVTHSFSASFIPPAESLFTSFFTSNILDPNLLKSSPRAPPYLS